MLTERRMDLIENFISNPNPDNNSINTLNLEDLIFLTAVCKHSSKDNVLGKENLFKSILIKKIKESEKLFLIIETTTKYPFLWSDNNCWIYSNLEYAEATINHYKDSYNLGVEVITNGQIESFLNHSYSLLGVEKLTLNLGEFPIELGLDELIELPDYSNIDEKSIPITNPKLQSAAIKFFQQFASPWNNENKDSMLACLEKDMLYEVIKGKYIVPIRKNNLSQTKDSKITFKKGTILELGALLSNNETWIATFTDWMEFIKGYNIEKWSALVMSYTDVASLNYGAGITINPYGFNLRLSNENIKAVDKFKKEIEEKGLQIV